MSYSLNMVFPISIGMEEITMKDLIDITVGALATVLILPLIIVLAILKLFGYIVAKLYTEFISKKIIKIAYRVCYVNKL